ncbi:MAG: hypothetical protein PHV93_03180 [Candidatus Pacebacteria bacterium]|nr:hypothetical protein [Candidatus Paceibacterota bacterium]
MKTVTKLGLLGAVAGVGYYLYGSEHAKKHREAASSWMKKAQKEVASQVKKLKEETLTKENYEKIVEEVGKKYQLLLSLKNEEVTKFVDILDGAWEDLKGQAHTTAKVIKRGMK